MFKMDFYKGLTLIFNNIEDLEGIVDADTLEIFMEVMEQQEQRHRQDLMDIISVVDELRDSLGARHWHKASVIEIKLDDIYTQIDLFIGETKK